MELLRRGQFDEAVGRIEDFGKQHTALTTYVDVELSTLKIEIGILELQVQVLEAEKADIEKTLPEFSVHHALRLGGLILKLLELHRSQATTDKERTETETDYSQYQEQYTETRQQPRFTLSADEQRELKRTFRKATQLCHPDVVAEALKSQAEGLFAELEAANDCNDLQPVLELLATLERGDIFVPRSETVTEKALLKHERARLQITQLRVTVQILQQSETYRKITQIEDWDAYFVQTREKLNEQLELLIV